MGGGWRRWRGWGEKGNHEEDGNTAAPSPPGDGAGLPPCVLDVSLS